MHAHVSRYVVSCPVWVSARCRPTIVRPSVHPPNHIQPPKQPKFTYRRPRAGSSPAKRWPSASSAGWSRSSAAAPTSRPSRPRLRVVWLVCDDRHKIGPTNPEHTNPPTPKERPTYRAQTRRGPQTCTPRRSRGRLLPHHTPPSAPPRPPSRCGPSAPAARCRASGRGRRARGRRWRRPRRRWRGGWPRWWRWRGRGWPGSGCCCCRLSVGWLVCVGCVYV